MNLRFFYVLSFKRLSIPACRNSEAPTISVSREEEKRPYIQLGKWITDLEESTWLNCRLRTKGLENVELYNVIWCLWNDIESVFGKAWTYWACVLGAWNFWISRKVRGLWSHGLPVCFECHSGKEYTIVFYQNFKG